MGPLGVATSGVCQQWSSLHCPLDSIAGGQPKPRKDNTMNKIQDLQQLIFFISDRLQVTNELANIPDITERKREILATGKIIKLLDSEIVKANNVYPDQPKIKEAAELLRQLNNSYLDSLGKANFMLRINAGDTEFCDKFYKWFQPDRIGLTDDWMKLAKEFKLKAAGTVEPVKQVEARKNELVELEGEWSNPMSKTRMMGILDIDTLEKFNSFAERQGIVKVNRSLHKLRLDGLRNEQKKRLKEG